MKRWKKQEIMYDTVRGAREYAYFLQVKLSGAWVSVASVIPTTDGRYMAASIFGQRLVYPSGNGAKAHKSLRTAKQEALDITESNAEWSVPW